MEQESETPLLYSTLRRAGYKLVLVIHAFFIIIATVGAVILMAALLIG